MSKLALNKSSLNRERKRLETFRRFLPALELKRKQLTALRETARAQTAELVDQLKAARDGLGERVPMLASEQFDLSGLVTVEQVRLGRQNAVGVELPVLEAVDVRVADYSYLAEPHWVDVAVDALSRVVELRVALAVAERRLSRLEEAVRKVTQRVNLFEKVLIPEAKENIRRISIHIGDAERAAVIRAKIAKSKRARGAQGAPA